MKRINKYLITNQSKVQLPIHSFEFFEFYARLPEIPMLASKDSIAVSEARPDDHWIKSTMLIYLLSDFVCVLAIL